MKPSLPQPKHLSQSSVLNPSAASAGRCRNQNVRKISTTSLPNSRICPVAKISRSVHYFRANMRASMPLYEEMSAHLLKSIPALQPFTLPLGQVFTKDDIEKLKYDKPEFR